MTSRPVPAHERTITAFVRHLLAQGPSHESTNCCHGMCHIDYFRHAISGRYFARVSHPTRRDTWFMSNDADSIRLVGCGGYTPGEAPGHYSYVLDFRRLRLEWASP